MAGAERQILIKFLGDTKGLDKAGKQGEKSVGMFGGATKKMAAAVGGFVAADQLISFFSDAVTGARESAKVMATTEAIIKSTGASAWTSAGQISDLAGALSEKTAVDDEVIQTGANLLLTFKNVRNEAGEGAAVFDRATEAAVDLAGAGFGSVDSAAKMLGKALNDPLTGITALSRAGVTFTQQQKDQIAALVQTGDVLSAQKIILEEVESQVGGTAAAQATAADRAMVAWGNFQEQVGALLIPVIERLAETFTDDVLPVLEDAAGWIEENSHWLGPLAENAGKAALAVGALALAVKGVMIMKSITSTALLPFVTGVERLDKKAPGAARGVRGLGTAIAGLATAALILPDVASQIAEGLDLPNTTGREAEQWASNFVSGLESVKDPAAAVRDEIARLDEQNKAWNVDLGLTNVFLTDWSGKSEQAYDRAEALRGMLPDLESAQEDSNQATAAGADAMAGQAAATGTATTALEDYLEATRIATDPVYALNDAVVGVTDAQTAYNEAVAEYGPESAEAQQAAIDLMGAVGDLESAALNGELSFEAFSGKLDQFVAQGVITAEQADAIRGRVELLRGAAEDYEGTYAADVTAQDKATAVIAGIERRLDDIDGTTARTYVDTVQRFLQEGRNPFSRNPGGANVALAGGGPFSSGTTALVGEYGPELVRFGAAGRVSPAAQTKDMLRADEPIIADIHIEIGGEVVRTVRQEITRDKRATKRAVGMGATRVGAAA